MASNRCCRACPESGTDVQQMINASVNGISTEFLCCGNEECARNQLKTASQGGCCWTECANPVDLDYSLPVFARSEVCASGVLGCELTCQEHITQGTNWLFCGELCKGMFRTAIYGPDDANLGVVTRIEKCSGCHREHANKPQLQRCGGCRLTVYCDRQCQVAHWHAGHKESCKLPQNT